MGSSAAAVVAGVLGAWALCPDVEAIDDDAVLRLATELEGHPDNVAACLLGGATLSLDRPTRGARRPARRRRRRSCPVVLVPGRRPCRRTSPAACCPTSCRTPTPRSTPAGPRCSCTRSPREPALLLEATEDRLHQRQRAAAMPESLALIDRLRADGHAAVVSGAGPSVLVLAGGIRTTRRRPAGAAACARSPASPRRGGRCCPLEVDRARGDGARPRSQQVSSR